MTSAVAERPETAQQKARTAIELKGVAIRYAMKGMAYEAVAAADVTVAEGEFVSIVGPTGCGKSTLLNVAAGLVRPSAGSCEIFGERLDGLNRQAGYLFQADALMPWKTAIDNVAIGLEIRGRRRAEALEIAAGWLRRVGLASFATRYPHMLSGGQKKRVALAQVLALNPRLLLMDEPFGPLDAQTRQIMGELLLSLWSEAARAVLFVTHDLEEAIALSDRVLIMAAGPSSRIIGDYPVPLGRPRDVSEARHDPEFVALHRTIWNALKAEVQKAYAQADHA